MSTKRLWDARDLVCSHKQIFEKKNGCLLWAIAAGAYFEVKVKCFCSKVSRFREVEWLERNRFAASLES